MESTIFSTVEPSSASQGRGSREPRESLDGGTLKRRRVEGMRQKTTLLDLIQSEQFGPANHALTSMLDTKDKLSVMQTSSAYRQGMKNTVWNINKRLLRFFENPLTFRSQLGKCDALISGSFALQFFEGVLWKESDLDIFVESGNNTEAMEKYLLEVAYTHTGSWSRPDHDRMEEYSNIKGIVECRTYHDSNPNGYGAKVQIISTKESPVRAILEGFYTTCIVNFITWNKAYSLFPKATFLIHQTIPLVDTSIYLGKLYTKYSKRGWPMWTHPLGQESYSKLFANNGEAESNRERRIGDSTTWIMKLDTTSVARLEKPDSVLEYSSYNISMGHGTDHHRCTIYAAPFQSNALRYRYLRSNWLYELAPIFERATEMQLFKLKESDQQRLQHRVRNHLGLWTKIFDKPDGWDYLDEQLPHYFAELKENPGLLRDLGYEPRY
ncbi:hypothetical protein F5Y16DRAFT_386197 [Xylariaceae sp. FL0255]|nr:hypothetical protein F5Y16DRAFT_386197 [Xylariaceae sp. FL0255]